MQLNRHSDTVVSELFLQLFLCNKNPARCNVNNRHEQHSTIFALWSHRYSKLYRTRKTECGHFPETNNLYPWIRKKKLKKLLNLYGNFADKHLKTVETLGLRTWPQSVVNHRKNFSKDTCLTTWIRKKTKADQRIEFFTIPVEQRDNSLDHWKTGSQALCVTEASNIYVSTWQFSALRGGTSPSIEQWFQKKFKHSL